MTHTDHLDALEWLIVFDGRKMLAFQNSGTRRTPTLALRFERLAVTGPARSLGTDRPGRVQPSVGTAGSAVETPDLHDAAEAAFVRETATLLDASVRDGTIRSAVVVAPPRAIGIFREAAPVTLKAVIRAELTADLTKEPVTDLERRFSPQG
ncbi:host attachment family protein [Chthonobacter albigriseus]|uniref:host attachment family protein n=1 Tax=Chthonobacter albigriseus TaxID=1683161 RepID=UPI0015EF3584|nr:host attachment family protein [Chthonobacter albigriseus]